jgi:Gpi18-like mannosyltransferase
MADTGIMNEGDHLPGEGIKKTIPSNWMVWFVLALISSIALRISLLDFESKDYRLWLSPWYDFFVTHGRWHGLGLLTDDFANYPPLYMYFISLGTLLPLPKLYSIKLISIVFDYIAAWYIWRLAMRRFSTGVGAAITATVFLFIPTVVMNSSLWGQCDIMYTTGFLAFLFYMREKRFIPALIAFGWACSLKPQAIFWCPLMLGLFVSRRLPWKWCWIPPAIYVICGIPEIVAGRPSLDVLGHWLRVHDRPGLVHNAPNWYEWVHGSKMFPGHEQFLFWTGIVLTLVGTAFLIFTIKAAKERQSGEFSWLINVALLSVLFPPFLLPGMHDRYFFAADVISVLYAIYVPAGRYPAILIQIASLLSYFPFLFNLTPISLGAAALFNAIALIWLVDDLVHFVKRPNWADSDRKQDVEESKSDLLSP